MIRKSEKRSQKSEIKKGGYLKMDIIKSIEHEQMKNKIPDLKVRNRVKVHVRLKGGNRERTWLSAHRAGVSDPVAAVYPAL